MKQVCCPEVGRVHDGGGVRSGGVDRSGVKQTVAIGEVLLPTVRIKHISFNQFKVMLFVQFKRMSAHMFGLLWVVEVSYGPPYGVAVFQQVPDDVVANVSVDARDKDALERVA